MEVFGYIEVFYKPTAPPLDARPDQSGRVRTSEANAGSVVNPSTKPDQAQGSSDHDAFDLVDGHRVRRPVVELRRLRRRVPGDLLSVLEGPPV